MAIALDKAVVIPCLEKYKSDKHGPTKANQSTPTTTIPAHPKGLGESSPDISLNHQLDDGKKRRTIGPIPKSNAKSTNGNAVAELQSASIAPIRQRLMTIVFGTRNHVRLPSRSAKTMPTGSDSRQSPNSKTKRMPDKDSPLPLHALTIASINNRTDNMTYIQPKVSTITTGNGFFKSFIAPDLMCSRAASSCTTLYHKSPDGRARQIRRAASDCQSWRGTVHLAIGVPSSP